MAIVGSWSKTLAGAACAASAACLVAPAHADVLLDTGTPGGFLGYYGFDVFVGQSVAIAFTPTQDYRFDTVSLWLMSNDGAAGRTLTVSLQTDAGGGAVPVAPSGSVLESWAHATDAVGWAPVLETLNSTTNPLLSAGQTYWIVAESSEPAFVNPVWVVAGDGNSYYVGNIDFQSGPDWQVGLTGGPVGTVVTASPVPEPAAWMLGLVGAPLLLGAMKRRAAKR